MNNISESLIRDFERQYGPFVHMAPRDKAIWLRYLLAGGSQYAPFQYDVRVGDGLDMGPTADPFTRRTALALTTKRIDVLCRDNDGIRIIEVKQRAGLSAVGQLIGYRNLYRLTRETESVPTLWLITDQLQPDMVHVLIENGINYAEVGL